MLLCLGRVLGATIVGALGLLGFESVAFVLGLSKSGQRVGAH